MAVQIRRARVSDVNAIANVTREFGNQGVMIPLAIGDVTERLREFQVAVDEKDKVLGCVAVHITWGELVEIRSLAVASEEQGRKIGRMLMEAAFQDTRELGATEVFTLTYIPDFFRHFGFDLVEHSTLPHKVWLDCVKCVKFPDCDEIAMKRNL